MSSGMLVLSERKYGVLKKIQEQRLESIVEAQLFMHALKPFFKLRRGVVSLVDHPLLWLVSAGLIVFTIGPNRVMRGFLSVWNLWQIVRFFKRRGIWSH
jgi:hypothetical protein